MSNDFYAITSYFNPFHNPERLANFLTFKKNLSIPLITIEWAPDSVFELSENDTDKIIKISEGDMMWQKERLLNIALDHLPLSCEYIAWLDCDIIFSSTNWHENAKLLLQEYDFIQLFDQVNYLSKSLSKNFNLKKLNSLSFEHIDISISKAVEWGGKFFPPPKNNEDKRDLIPSGNPGMAYASKTKIMKSHKFYDKNIAGGGDIVLSASLYNELEELFMHRHLSEKHRIDIKEWANELIEKNYKATYLNNTIYHLWHGELSERQYAKRYQILNKHNYDPAAHIKNESKKPWFWKEASETLKFDIYQYMQSRENR